jgi:Protein of unknown function (DUF1579)
MKPGMSAVYVLSFILASVAVAQTPQMPTPGPEIKRLQYYVGTWKSEYDLKPGPMGPGGKVTAVDQSQMMPGGFFVETRTDGKGAMGVLKGLAIMGYDAAEKVYTYDAFNNFGEVDHFKGTLQGDTWTWTSEGKIGGNKARLRFTAKEVSPTMYTMKFEMATGGEWTTVMEGKATKTK